jgi:hypothetical protein
MGKKKNIYIYIYGLTDRQARLDEATINSLPRLQNFAVGVMKVLSPFAGFNFIHKLLMSSLQRPELAAGRGLSVQNDRLSSSPHQ